MPASTCSLNAKVVNDSHHDMNLPLAVRPRGIPAQEILEAVTSTPPYFTNTFCSKCSVSASANKTIHITLVCLKIWDIYDFIPREIWAGCASTLYAVCHTLLSPKWQKTSIIAPQEILLD